MNDYEVQYNPIKQMFKLINSKGNELFESYFLNDVKAFRDHLITQGVEDHD